VRFAKAKPENLIYGHPGPASQPHLGMLAVLKAIGADGLGVPFQGAGPMAQALLSGTVMAITETPAVATASNLPVLAALTDRRIAALPDVRTMKELGYPAESFTAGGLIAPANTPPAAVTTLENACAQATARAEYKLIVERLNVEARYLPGEAFRKMFEQDSMASADAIKRAGLGENK
jgi:tripartite-type tricarboxylate transporter receptor subunit TctC